MSDRHEWKVADNSPLTYAALSDGHVDWREDGTERKGDYLRNVKLVTDEILRLAEENAELRKVIERDGDIRRALPVLDAALKDRDRLAEEVERLKGATIYSDSVAAGSVIALGNQTAAKAVAEERARIRRELLDFAREVAWDEAAFLPYLGRICPQGDILPGPGRLRPLLDEAIENLAEATILEDGRGTREAVVRVDLLGADLDRIFGKG